MNEVLTRHDRRRLRTRQKLLDAARRVIARMGYEAAGVLDITEEADVSKGTFYLHFKDKEDLTRTLIMAGFDDLRAELNAAIQPGQAPENLQGTLEVLFRYAAQHRDLFRIMLGRQASAELTIMAYEYFTAVVRDLLTTFSPPPEGALAYPPDLVANYITGAGVRLGLWWIDDDHGFSPEAMAASVYRLITGGLFSLHGPWPASDLHR